jgi:uncharacterized protein YceK
MKRYVVLLMLLIFLSGCATVGHLQTSSGRPEVFVEGATIKDATNATVALLTANGWQIEQATDYMVQAVHTSDNTMVDFMWGSNYDFHQTWYRLSFTFVQESNGIRIYGVQQVVANRGTGFERVLQLTSQKAYEGTQSWLESIRNSIQQKR